MKAFIKNILLFVFPVLILAVILELLCRNIPNNYSYKSNYLEKYSKNTQILFLGNSHVYFGINPVFIKKNSFNAAYISQSLDYDFEILNKYINKLDSLKYIIVPVDYFSLYSKLETSIEKWRVKNYVVYYGINRSNSFLNNSEILNGKLKENFTRLKNYYFKPGNSDITCNVSGWGTTYSSKENSNLEQTGITSAKRHTLDSNLYFNENLLTLKSIIKLAENKNAKVVFVTCPAYHSYVEHLEPMQMSKTINTINQLVKSNSNTVYYNLLTDRSFVAKDFFDADHLNEIGAKKFTLKMDSLIDGLSEKVKQNTAAAPAKQQSKK